MAKTIQTKVREKKVWINVRLEKGAYLLIKAEATKWKESLSEVITRLIK